MASLLYSVASTGNAAPDMGLPPNLAAWHPPTAPAKQVDDTANVRQHRAWLGFAMSVDVAEIANTVDAAPVTVLDVVATTDRDGGALKKMSDFAEQAGDRYPTRTPSRSAARNVRHILDNVSNDLRGLGNDDASEKERTAAPARRTRTTTPTRSSR